MREEEEEPEQIGCCRGGSHVIAMNLIDQRPIEALFHLSSEIALCHPPEWPHRKTISLVVSTVDRLSSIFDRIRKFLAEDRDTVSCYPITSVLCFKQTFDVLYRARSLIELCTGGSKIAALMLVEAHAQDFRAIVADLAEILGLVPLKSLEFMDGFKSCERLLGLVKRDCERISDYLDPADVDLRDKIVRQIEELERDHFPDRDSVDELFEMIGLSHFEARVNEVKMLEFELLGQIADEGASAPATVEFVRYCKFVFFGNKWPDPRTYERSPGQDWVFPPVAICPITRAVMRDPVVVETGATYDRPNIERWLAMGNTTCPVTGEPLDCGATITCVPPLRALVHEWQKRVRITLRVTEKVTKKMHAAYLVEMLGSTQKYPPANCRVISEMISLAGASKEWRLLLGEAEPFSFLLQRKGTAERQELAMTAVRILAIERPNLSRIADDIKDGIELIFYGLQFGQSWVARGEAAEVIYWLSTVEEFRIRMVSLKSGERCMVKELQVLMREGNSRAQHGAMAGIIGIGTEKEKLVELRFLLNRWEHGEKDAVAKLVLEEPVGSLMQEMGLGLRWTRVRWHAHRLVSICSLRRSLNGGF